MEENGRRRLDVEELLLTICLVLILAVSLLQVIIRRIPGINSLTWAEEFCRFIWIFSVFLSLPYCIKHKSMLRVDAALKKLPMRAQSVLAVVSDACVFAVLAALTVGSVIVVCARFASGETSPAMLVPMWILYALMLLGYAAGSVRALQTLIDDIRKRRAE